MFNEDQNETDDQIHGETHKEKETHEEKTPIRASSDDNGLTSEEKRTYDRLRDRVKGALRAKVPEKYEKAVEACLFLPDFFVLIVRLLKDPRVPAKAKARLALFTAYLASPIDIVPDFIPVVGQLDDLVGAVFVIRGIMDSTPKEVILEHWSGEGEILDVAKSIMDVAGEVFGSGILKRIFAHFRK